MSNLFYRQNMLDHAKNPRNFGELHEHSVSVHAINRHCGDELTLYIKEEKGVVKDIKFKGTGCAVAISSASMLTEDIKGKKIEEIKKITKEDVLDNFGEELTLSRQKCALLVYDGLQQMFAKIDKLSN